MKYTNRADLFIAAGESIKMQEKAGISPDMKIDGDVWPIRFTTFVGDDGCGKTDNEFPLAVVEGKPVFVGDELYSTVNGYVYVATDKFCMRKETRTSVNPIADLDNLSWNPPKPKTVMVELTVDEAISHSNKYDVVNTSDYNKAAEKIRKAISLGEME